MCLGHNAVIKGVETVSTFFDAAIAATEDWHTRILQATEDQSKDASMIAADLGADRQVYVHANTMDQEVLCYLSKGVE